MKRSLQVKEGLKGTEEAYKAFKSISSAMGEVNQKVVEVSASVEEMTAVSHQIFDAIKQVEGIAEKSSIIVKKVLRQQSNNLLQWKK